MVSAMTIEISVGLPLGIGIFEIIATRLRVLPPFHPAPLGDTTMDTVLSRTETRIITSQATETRPATRETSVCLPLDHRRPLSLADHPLPLRLAGTAFGLRRGTSPSGRISQPESKKTRMTHIAPMAARTDTVQADPNVATADMIAAARVHDPRTVGLLLPSASC